MSAGAEGAGDVSRGHTDGDGDGHDGEATFGHAPGNPRGNRLGPGLTEQAVAAAVARSGYPLQVAVADALRGHFPTVQEEWGYVDPGTGELRALDVFCERRLVEADGRSLVLPYANLLVECKQSDLPYVFFLTAYPTPLRDFPLVAGTVERGIGFKGPAGSSHGYLPWVLGLEKHPFVAAPPAYCTSFARCARKGKDLELSGTEAFFGLMLPLTKAMRHFETARRPLPTFTYLGLHVTFGVGVLDAPMIGVATSERTPRFTYLPWVRVGRHESYPGAAPWDAERLMVVDIVHREYLEAYVGDHALPFAEEVASRLLARPIVVADGREFATDVATQDGGEWPEGVMALGRHGATVDTPVRGTDAWHGRSRRRDMSRQLSGSGPFHPNIGR